MIATAVPTRRREELAIDMTTVLRLPMPFVNPLTQLVWNPSKARRNHRRLVSWRHRRWAARELRKGRTDRYTRPGTTTTFLRRRPLMPACTTASDETHIHRGTCFSRWDNPARSCRFVWTYPGHRTHTRTPNLSVSAAKLRPYAVTNDLDAAYITEFGIVINEAMLDTIRMSPDPRCVITGAIPSSN